MNTIVLFERASNRSERDYAFLQYMKCTEALNGMYEELGCACFKSSTID